MSQPPSFHVPLPYHMITKSHISGQNPEHELCGSSQRNKQGFRGSELCPHLPAGEKHMHATAQ